MVAKEIEESWKKTSFPTSLGSNLQAPLPVASGQQTNLISKVKRPTTTPLADFSAGRVPSGRHRPSRRTDHPEVTRRAPQCIFPADRDTTSITNHNRIASEKKLGNSRKESEWQKINTRPIFKAENRKKTTPVSPGTTPGLRRWLRKLTERPQLVSSTWPASSNNKPPSGL